jgi:hypothetical protein
MARFAFGIEWIYSGVTLHDKQCRPQKTQQMLHLANLTSRRHDRWQRKTTIRQSNAQCKRPSRRLRLIKRVKEEISALS